MTQFQRAFRRNDKILMTSCITFLAHLVNHEVLSLIRGIQLILLLLNDPTDDSVEVAKEFMLHVGQKFKKNYPAITKSKLNKKKKARLV